MKGFDIVILIIALISAVSFASYLLGVSDGRYFEKGDVNRIIERAKLEGRIEFIQEIMKRQREENTF